MPEQLRRLHETTLGAGDRQAQAAANTQRYIDRVLERIDSPVLAGRRAVIRRRLAVLREALPQLPAAFCHGSFGSSAWRWQRPTRSLALTGFTRSQLLATVVDFARPSLLWTNRPALHDAFNRGYGRPLDELEQLLLGDFALLAALDQIEAHTDHDLPWKRICHVRVRLRGCPKLIDLASGHLCHFDPSLRATEARRLTTLADHGRTALIGMDANSYPHRAADETTELLDWAQVEDPVHFQHRTIERDGKRVSDTQPSEILTGGPKAVFTDFAHHGGTVLQQKDALAATASLRRTDQGPPQRIDWLLGTPDWNRALLRVEVITTKDVRRVTDHALVIAHFSLPAVQQMLSTAA